MLKTPVVVLVIMILVVIALAITAHHYNQNSEPNKAVPGRQGGPFG